MASPWEAPAESEASLEARPLEFLCENSAEPSAWQLVLWDEARRSFSFHRPAALSLDIARSFFCRLSATAPWQELRNKTGIRVSRHTSWFTRDPSCRCDYTYGFDTRVAADDAASSKGADDTFRATMEDLFVCLFGSGANSPLSLPPEAMPDCANLNFYEHGSQGVGWHADDELLFQGGQRDCPIISLSLGGAREFWLALRCPGGMPDVRQGVAEVDLRDGDLITMEGMLQKHCLHSVPLSCISDQERQHPRINVTFRWLRVHKLRCPLAREARQLVSDAKDEHADAVPSADDSEAIGPKAKNALGRDPKSAQQTAEARVDVTEVAAGNEASSIDPASSEWRALQARTRAEGAVIASPLHPTAQGFFGEAAQRSPTFARPFAPVVMSWLEPLAALGWVDYGSPIKWQACDACGHSCYGGGRPCREGLGDWAGQAFCRCCWEKWAVTAFQEQIGHTQFSMDPWGQSCWPSLSEVW